MTRDIQTLLARICAIHAAIRDQVVLSCEQATMDHLAEIVSVQAGDTIFAIDRVSEEAFPWPSHWRRVL